MKRIFIETPSFTKRWYALGFNEDDLAELIGEEWSQLEFVSLRYWMRNYIQCNNKDHRWFFTHAILRQTLMQQSTDFLQKCQDNFFPVFCPPIA